MISFSRTCFFTQFNSFRILKMKFRCLLEKNIAYYNPKTVVKQVKYWTAIPICIDAWELMRFQKVKYKWMTFVRTIICTESMFWPILILNTVGMGYLFPFEVRFSLKSVDFLKVISTVLPLWIIFWDRGPRLSTDFRKFGIDSYFFM